jgi:hypothetical protein
MPFTNRSYCRFTVPCTLVLAILCTAPVWERSTHEPICQQGVNSLDKYVVAKAGFDGNGTAIFKNVPCSGIFYVVADTAYTNHHIWNIKVDLRPGANSLVLDERNAVPIDK